jgi:hypothetical protein
MKPFHPFPYNLESILFVDGRGGSSTWKRFFLFPKHGSIKPSLYSLKQESCDGLCMVGITVDGFHVDGREQRVAPWRPGQADHMSLLRVVRFPVKP